MPVTIVRPGAIHGPGSTYSREWWLVRRVLDRRPAVLLGNVNSAAGPDWRRSLPDVAAQEHFFDYQVEDAFLRGLAR
ncbi:hypothetical protein [Actinomadura sp. DC4]|uniref:hypothetical protein n=1 Tax=Actinomadura sp. DC4 TaxID=3055069 RepID=UPI0025B081E5|nr:hypothetical protein [Actinomadura sp. DC4]MDN3353148.1 hypothetical protein [Actinomadura sp. DC4]